MRISYSIVEMRNSRIFPNRRLAIVRVNMLPSWWNWRSQWCEEEVSVVGSRSDWLIVPGFKPAPKKMVELLASYEVRLFL